jgi:hypothetical protein
MLALCVIALATIVVQHAFRLDPQIERVLDYADSPASRASFAAFAPSACSRPRASTKS